MERLLQLLLPALLVVVVTLVPSGRLDVNSTVDVGAAVTSLFVLIACRQLWCARQKFRLAATARCCRWAGLEAGLAVFVSQPLAERIVPLARVCGERNSPAIHPERQ